MTWGPVLEITLIFAGIFIVVDNKNPLGHEVSRTGPLLVLVSRVVRHAAIHRGAEMRAPPSAHRAAPRTVHGTVLREFLDSRHRGRPLRGREFVRYVEDGVHDFLGFCVETRDQFGAQLFDGGAIDGRRAQEIERLFAERLAGGARS